MSQSKQYYKVLEIPPGSSRQEVKQAFRAMAKTYHPDLYPYDEVSRLSCERKMRQINEAYEFLRGFAPDKPEESGRETPPPPDGDPRPDLAARYGAKESKDEPWPEPEPVAEDEPGLRPYNEEVAKFSARRRPQPWSPFRHGIPFKEPDFAGLFQTAASFGVMIAALAGLYFIDIMSFQGYFRTLRIVVCLGCAQGAYYGVCRGYWDVAIACLALSLSMNPAVPLKMSLEAWDIFNPLCTFILVVFWLVMFNRESDKALGIRRWG